MADLSVNLTTEMSKKSWESSSEFGFHLGKKVTIQVHAYLADRPFETLQIQSNRTAVCFYLRPHDLRTLAEAIGRAADELDAQYVEAQQAASEPVPTADELIAAALATPQPTADLPL